MLVQLRPDGPRFDAAALLENRPGASSLTNARPAFSHAIALEVAARINAEASAAGPEAGIPRVEWLPAIRTFGYLYPEDADLGPEPIEPVLVDGHVLFPLGQFDWPWSVVATQFDVDGEVLDAAEALARLVTLGDVPASLVGATTDPYPLLSRSDRARPIEVLS